MTIADTDTPKASSLTQKDLGYTLTGVDIEINSDCNRACRYCPNSLMQRKNQGRMSEALFLTILQRLSDIHYCGRISFHFYNEPLLSPDLERFVSLTKKHLPRSWIELYTNGTLLTEPRLRDLAERGVSKFVVTRHHGERAYGFEELLDTLEPALRKLVKFQKSRDLLLSSRGGLVKATSSKAKPPLDLPCFIPSMVMVITVNGNVLPCFEDYEERNVMGNVVEQSIAEIWQSAKYTQFREDLKRRKRADHPVCRDCNCQLVFF